MSILLCLVIKLGLFFITYVLLRRQWLTYRGIDNRLPSHSWGSLFFYVNNKRKFWYTQNYMPIISQYRSAIFKKGLIEPNLLSVWMCSLVNILTWNFIIFLIYFSFCIKLSPFSLRTNLSLKPQARAHKQKRAISTREILSYFT